jgi:putative ABC transport system permease protein
MRDNGEAPKVVIVNEAVAKRFYGSPEGAIGKRLTIWRDEKFPREIIGVVGDTKADTLERETSEQIYVPHAQDPSWGFMALVIRTAGDPAAFVPVLRRELQAIDKDQPLYNIRTMEDVVRTSLGTRRVSMLLFSVFAGAALLLAAVGIYGVMAYSVTQRTHEIGIRMALGAQAGDVLRMVVRQGMTLVLIGIASASRARWAHARDRESALRRQRGRSADVRRDRALLAFVALLACYLPARRAAKLDPMIALARH